MAAFIPKFLSVTDPKKIIQNHFQVTNCKLLSKCKVASVMKEIAKI